MQYVIDLDNVINEPLLSDTIQSKMNESFQWMNYLTLYLPLWTLRLPANKYRSIYCNLVGMTITILSITAFIALGEYNFYHKFADEAKSIDKFNDVINATMLILQTTARIDQFFIFITNFNYPWKNRFVSKWSNIYDIQKKNIASSNSRMKTIFVLFIILSFSSKLWYLNDMNISMTITIWLMLPTMIMSTIICSIIFLKYELYLDNVTNMILDDIPVTDIIQHYEKIKKLFDVEYNNWHTWKLWYHLVLTAQIVTSWFEISNIIETNSISFSFIAYIIWFLGLIVWLTEIIVSASKLNGKANSLEKLIETRMIEHAKYHSNNDDDSGYQPFLLYITRNKICVNIFGIEIIYKNIIKVVSLYVLLRAISYVAAYWIKISS